MDRKIIIRYWAPLFLFLVSVVEVYADIPDTDSGSGNSSACDPKEQLCNPLKVQTIEGFLSAILQVLVVFATPIVVFYIMYAGYLFVTARGDTSKIEDARRALLWAVVGGVIILGASVIATVIKGTVAGIT